MKKSFSIKIYFKRPFTLLRFSILFTFLFNQAIGQVQLSDSAKGSISLNLALAIPIGLYSSTETDYSNFYLYNDNNASTSSFNQKGGYADGGGLVSLTYQNYQIHKKLILGINSGLMLNGTYPIQDPPYGGPSYSNDNVNYINRKNSSNPWLVPYTVGQIGYRIKLRKMSIHFIVMAGGCFVSPSKYSSYFEVKNPISSQGSDNFNITTSYSSKTSGLYGGEIGLKYNMGKLSLDLALTYLSTPKQTFIIKKEVDANVTTFVSHGGSYFSNYKYTITDSKEFTISNIMLSVGLSYYIYPR